ncbi:MAG: hypothetical protein IKH16_12485 [Selenomonadaceae bacterium]|nr:hypothetical protein [Selenomonadaceae bacterium]
MPLSVCGKVTMGNGTPAGRVTCPQMESPVRTRKASPEELAELDTALKKKYGEKKPAPKKAKAKAADAEAAKMRKRKSFTKAELERIHACCNLPRERWEQMRDHAERLSAFVTIAGAVNGWDKA